MTQGRRRPDEQGKGVPSGETSSQPTGAAANQQRQIAVFHQTKPVIYDFNDSEVAAWYTRIQVSPGDYPLVGPVERGRVGRCAARLPGTVVDEYHPALWGGVPVGTRPYVPRGIGLPAVYPLWMDGYVLARLVAERDGRTEDGWFELTDPSLEVRSRQTLTTRTLPHAWSYCQTCGGYMGPMPGQGTVPAGFRERLFRAQEQRHQADSGCERPYMLHAGGGSVLAVGEHHELVERDHRDPFTIVYLAAGQTFHTLAEAFEVSPGNGSITERVVYDDGRPPFEWVLTSYTSPIVALPAQFAARHQAALEELRAMGPDQSARLRCQPETAAGIQDSNSLDL